MISNRRWPVIILLTLATFFRVIVAIFSPGHNHPDEHFQVLEPAFGIVNHYWIRTWEWERGIRSFFLPGFYSLPLFFFQFLKIKNPQVWALGIRLLNATISLTGIYYSYQLTKIIDSKKENSHLSSLINISLMSLFWLVLYFSVRSTGENLSMNLLPMMTYYFFKNEKEHSALIGLIMGISFGVRFQNIFFIFGLFCLLLYEKKFRSILIIGSSFMVVLLFLGFLDLKTWGTLWHSPLAYFQVNILEGVAANRFGVAPWHRYLTWFLRYFSLGGVVVLFFSLQSFFFCRQLWIPVATFFFAHLIVGHKEDRFLLPIVPFLFILTSIGLARIKKKKLFYFALILLMVGNIYKTITHPWKMYQDVVHRYPPLVKNEKIKGILMYGTEESGTGGYFYLAKNIPLYFFKNDNIALEKLASLFPHNINTIVNFEDPSKFIELLKKKNVNCFHQIQDDYYLCDN